MPPARPLHPRGGPLFFAAALSLLTATALCVTSAVSYLSATRWVDPSLAVRDEASSGSWLTLIGALLLVVASSALLLIAWRREHVYEAVLTKVARDARGRLERLSDLASALSDARAIAQVAETVVEQGTRATGAEMCTLYWLDETRTALELLGDRGVAPDVAGKTKRITEASGGPGVFAAMTSAVATWAENDAEYAAIHPSLTAVLAPGARAFWSVPLLAENRPVGRLAAGFRAPRRFSDDEHAFVETIANQCAQALMRAARTEGEEEVRLKEAEEARAQERWLRGEAELASRSKDEFLATVSHELRTPLNAILGWTVTLRGRRPPEDIDRPLAIIERNARTQAKLIEDVLDVSRIISGKLALNLRPTNVAEAVSAAIDTVSPAADAKNIEMKTAMSDTSLTITADSDRLQQIVWNLLSNAVKFTPKGGQISVRVHREGSEVRIRVSDTGEGIRREVLPVIFEPFRQADASTTRYHGGLGLGLAIVKQLVCAHGGSVLAESDGPGKGAMFEVQLPARSAVPAVSKVSRATATQTAGPAVTDGPRLDGLRVLVIDDEEDALALVDEVLRERGAEVFLASSASDALDKVTLARPDVVVSDIGMPEIDGYALMRQLRARAPGAGGRTPAIALTAYARTDDAHRAIAAGYQMHLAKPVDPRQLVTVVAHLGGRSGETS